MTDNTAPIPPANISTVSIESEMQQSYLDYAMSVIVSRALPDVRDGLKPVHRRILFAMKEGGYTSDKSYKKSARIVGDVMGKYHPHGDSAIYDAMVRMAQDFSMSLPLVDGQGNFGSMDDDPAAAMRYTEARSAKAAEVHLEDLDKDTVAFRPNYDESVYEPTVLPARYPNLLVNGASGIAVGMATNIPPHNLGEVIDGCFAYLDNPDITAEELIEYIPAPDFPTGGIILGKAGIHGAYTAGRGSIKMRGKTSFEEIRKDKMAIIIHEIPYQVSKKRLIERIAEVVQAKTVEGITDIRDESDRDGVRVVIELRRDSIPDVVLNQLFKYTPLQTSFGANMLAINGGRPMRMALHEIIGAFIDFREEVITRRTKYELNKARDRAHVLIGLAVAVTNIDRVIKIVRNAANPQDAREQLIAEQWEVGEIRELIELVNEPRSTLTDDGIYIMSETQARAILDLKLHRLTGLERTKVSDELNGVVEAIKEFLKILGNRDVMLTILREELADVQTRFAVPRRTELSDLEFEADMEDLIAKEDMVVTVSHAGYIKRVPLGTYRAQRRGGKGRSGANLKDEDMLTDIFVANTHTPMVFFSNKGMAYKMKVYRLPLGSPTSRGKALINLLPLEQDEKISVVMPLPDNAEDAENLTIVFATSHGTCRRNPLSAFMNIRSNGLIAMKLGEGEKLIAVRTCSDDQDILLSTRLGKAIRFRSTDVRVFTGRTSTGVRGIKLAKKGDEVVGISILNNVAVETETRDQYLKLSGAIRRLSHDDVEATYTQAVKEIGGSEMGEEQFTDLREQEQFILTVSDKGYGKRTSAYEYRVSGRGGQGITNMELTEKNGEVVASYQVEDTHQIMMVSDGGQLIRMPVRNIRFVGRSSQGVTLFKVSDGETVCSVTRVRETDDDDEDGDDIVEGEVVDTTDAPETAPESASEPESEDETPAEEE